MTLRVVNFPNSDQGLRKRKRIIDKKKEKKEIERAVENTVDHINEQKRDGMGGTGRKMRKMGEKKSAHTVEYKSLTLLAGY